MKNKPTKHCDSLNGLKWDIEFICDIVEQIDLKIRRQLSLEVDDNVSRSKEYLVALAHLESMKTSAKHAQNCINIQSAFHSGELQDKL